MRAYAESRLNLSVHSFQCAYSVENTLTYMFNHLRCGIYVMIRGGQVAIFAPFVNKNYSNTWGNVLEVEGGSVDEYYSDKAKLFREEQYISDKTKW